MDREKEFSIRITRTRLGRDNSFTIAKGTLAELIKKFSYTLELGNSVRSSINRNPKTIKSFVSNLQKSFEIIYCYDRIIIKFQEKREC
jgi:hypothetical protein